jgi:peptidoglycan hydrolase CwlO-like protein
MNESIINLITIAVTGGISGFFGWFIQKKTKQTEAQRNEIDNANKVLKYYREMVDDLGQRLTEAIKELAEARKAIHELEQKVEALTTELIKYKQLNGKK